MPTFPTAAFAAAGGFFRFEAQAQSAAAVAQSFNPADVDTGNARITLPDLGFGAFSTYASAKGTRGWFTTTGTLPSPLEAGVYYYRVDLGGNLARFYREATDADWAVLPGAVEGELVRPAQRYAQAVDHVVFTTQGTGVHTFNTWPLTNTVVNQVAGKTAYTAVSQSTTDRNTFFEIETDANGGKFFYTKKIVSDHVAGSFRGYGKTYDLGPTAQRLNIMTEVGQKRWIWAIQVINPQAEFERVVRKTGILAGAGVDTGTNIITKASHPFATANLVRFLAYPGSTIPAPFIAGTDYFVRSVSSSTMSFHPTSADASANTNIIDITTTGADFIIYAPQRVGDGIRSSRIMELIEPGAPGTSNILAPMAPDNSKTLQASAYSASGSTAGEIVGIYPDHPDGTKVRVWFPPGAVPPTCVDTGLALANGDYWATRKPGSGGTGRLHRTLASALASVGVATNVSDCIKFSVAPTGESSFLFSDDVLEATLDCVSLSAAQAPFTVKMTTGAKVSWVTSVDLNDPAATGIMCMQGFNSAVSGTEIIDATGTKGLSAAAVNHFPGNFLNAGASHVAVNSPVYALYVGATVGAPNYALLQQIVDYTLGTEPVEIGGAGASVSHSFTRKKYLEFLAQIEREKELEEQDE